MKKTFNYTGRKRLFYKGKNPDFRIKLNEEDNYSSSFVLELTNFKKFKSFGANRFITLDCFDSNYFEHINFGNISNIEVKDLQAVSLPAQAESLRFHLKVINEKKSILAMAKNINANTTVSLFGVVAKDMKDIWITEVDDGQPLIYVNKELKIKQQLKKLNPKLILAILPAAFRDFLKKFLTSGQVEHEGEWAMAWMHFAEKFTDGEPHPKKISDSADIEQAEKWIEKFSENYTYEFLEKKFKLKEKYKKEED